MKKSLFFTAMFFLLTVHSDVLTPKDIINSVEKNFINLLIQEEKIIQANEQINRARGDYDSEFKDNIQYNDIENYIYINFYLINQSNTIKHDDKFYEILEYNWNFVFTLIDNNYNLFLKNKK